MAGAPDVDVEQQLLQGIADLLQTAGVGTQGGATGIVIVDGELNAAPDQGIAINVSPGWASAAHTDADYRVQLRLRGTKDPRTLRRIAQGCFDTLHGISAVPIGRALIAHMWRTSGASLGRDANGRWERSDNYLAQVTWPATELLPE